MSISLYEVLRAGRGQFGILAGISNVYLTYLVLRAGHGQFGNFEGVSISYFTLCSTQSGSWAIWEFGRGFYFLFYFI